jgi:flagellar biosynthetic protein FliR
MTELFGNLGFAGLLIVARVGGCLAMLPGFGSHRIPLRIRILVALALSLAVSPMIIGEAGAALAGLSEFDKAKVMGGEMLVGTSLGLMARLYMYGLQFAANLLTNAIGLAATPGAPIDDGELAPPLVNLIMVTATALIFAVNLHHVMLLALFDSYSAIRIGASVDPGWHLDQIVLKLSATWSMGLRLAAPFVIFSLIVNLAIGFANKFTPQISIYFMTTGLIATLGLIVLFLTVDDMLGLFLQEIRGFLD